jgi:hypothetical protein
MKEVYESIRNDEIRVGDTVAVCAAKVTGIAEHYSGTGKVYTLENVGGVMLEDDESIKAAFRQLAPERNPDVLMRAVENIAWKLCAGKTVAYWERCVEVTIQQAIRELENEASQ